MSSQTRWREEQVLVICPGSSTTMAQLGCSELTPPSQRFPTRMFRDEESGAWRPYHTYKRKKKSLAGSNGHVEEAAQNGDKKDDEEWETVENPDSTEGAVYPMQGMQCSRLDGFCFAISRLTLLSFPQAAASSTWRPSSPSSTTCTAC